MTQEITIRLKNEARRAFLLELLGSLDFVEVVSANGNGTAAAAKTARSNGQRRRLDLSPRKRKIVEGIKEALREVELHEQGKIALQPARQMLAELKDELQTA